MTDAKSASVQLDEWLENEELYLAQKLEEEKTLIQPEKWLFDGFRKRLTMIKLIRRLREQRNAAVQGHYDAFSTTSKTIGKMLESRDAELLKEIL